MPPCLKLLFCDVMEVWSNIKPGRCSRGPSCHTTSQGERIASIARAARRLRRGTREAQRHRRELTLLRRTLGSSLRSPAEGEGNEGFAPPPEKDLESPSSTRLEALVPSRDSRAMTRSPSPCAWRHEFPGTARAPSQCAWRPDFPSAT